MSKLKLGAIPDDKPVKLAVELPAQVNRDLIAYADALGRETGQSIEPTKLIGRETPFSQLDRGVLAAAPRRDYLPNRAAVERMN